MGRITTLHGFIQEYPDREQKYWEYNQNMIEQLPSKSDFPFLNRGMFYVPKETDAKQISYWGRIILLGGSFKRLEDYWEEWHQRFESFLSKLIWSEVKIHLITEWYPEQIFTWHINTNYSEKLFNNSEIIPPTKNDWKFEGLRDFKSLLG